MKVIINLFILLTLSNAVCAKIYKCVETNGSINYSEKECLVNQQEQVVKHLKITPKRNAAEKDSPKPLKATIKFGVPFYPGAQTKGNRTSKGGQQNIGIRDLTYAVKASPNEVLAFYQKQPQIKKCRTGKIVGMHWCQLKSTKRLSHGDLTIADANHKKSTKVSISLFYFK